MKHKRWLEEKRRSRTGSGQVAKGRPGPSACHAVELSPLSRRWGGLKGGSQKNTPNGSVEHPSSPETVVVVFCFPFSISFLFSSSSPSKVDPCWIYCTITSLFLCLNETLVIIDPPWIFVQKLRSLFSTRSLWPGWQVGLAKGIRAHKPRRSP